VAGWTGVYVSARPARGLSSHSEVHFIDLDCVNEVIGRRIERSCELLDTPPKRPGGDVKFGPNWRILVLKRNNV